MKRMRVIISLLAFGLLPFAQQAWATAPGDVSLLQVPTGNVALGAALSLNAQIDTGTSKLASYQVKVTFDPTQLQLASSGSNGVTCGADPVSTACANLTADTVSNSATSTTMTIQDFVGSGGAGPKTALNPFNIAFTVPATATPGSTTVSVSVAAKGLIDADTLDTLGTPNGMASTVTITAVKTPQILTFGTNPGPVTFADNGSFTVKATSDNTSVGAKPVTYMSTTTAVCTITPNDGTDTTGVVTMTTTGTCTIAANQAADATHSAAAQKTQDVVIKAALISQVITFGVNPGPKDLVVNGTFNVTATSSNPTGSSIMFSSTTPAVCTATATGTVTMLTAGNCIIAANQAGDNTHSAAPQAIMTVVINPAQVLPQTITFGANPGPVTLVVGGTFTVTATSSTGSTGQAIIFSSMTPAVCTVTATGTVTMLTPGTCIIAANQPSDSTHSAAPQVTMNITINPAAQPTPQTITLGTNNPSPTQLVAGNSFTVSATASSGLAVAFTSKTLSVCTVAGNTVTSSAPGTCTIAANQGGDATYAPASEKTLSFIITAAAPNVMPIPTLSWWGLLMLTGMLGFVAMLQRRKEEFLG